MIAHESRDSLNFLEAQIGKKPTLEDLFVDIEDAA